jgi:hypothetical protein
MGRHKKGYADIVEDLVLKAVAGGPRPILSIIGAVDAPETSVRRAVSMLLAMEKLKDCGVATKFGYSMRGTNARAYGLPCDASSGSEDLDEIEDAQLRPRKKSGSGVIAPPPYATGYRWGNV